jgi:hypothetical protein
MPCCMVVQCFFLLLWPGAMLLPTGLWLAREPPPSLVPGKGAGVCGDYSSKILIHHLLGSLCMPICHVLAIGLLFGGQLTYTGDNVAWPPAVKVGV